MKPIIFLAMLFVACASVSQRDVSSLSVSSAITKAGALRTAVAEVKKRKLILPADYKTEISGSYISQETGPTIPVFTISFFGGAHPKRIMMYQVGINRHTGDILFFFNLLTVKPSDIY